MAIESLAFIPALLLLVLANYTEKKKGLRILTQVFLFLTVMLLLVEGILLIELSGTVQVEGFENTTNYGYGTIITALIALLLFFKPIRTELAKVIDIEPDNWLHVTAGVFAVMLIGLSISIAANFDVVELSREVGTNAVSVIIQDVFFVVIAFFGVGWMIRRDWKQLMKRLGLVKPSLKDIAMSIGFFFLLLAIVTAASIIVSIFDPDSSLLDADDPTIEMIGGVTVLTAILFALGAGIGEEILFRGAIQPRFGIILTSIVFTIAHTQYLNLTSMSVLFALSLVFGYERKRLNTTACIITHTLYDMFLLLIIALI